MPGYTEEVTNEDDVPQVDDIQLDDDLLVLRVGADAVTFRNPQGHGFVRTPYGLVRDALDGAIDAADVAIDAANGFLGSTFSDRTIPVIVNSVRTAGYSAYGDGADALYKRVGSEPSHLGKLRSANGVWFEYAGETSRVQCFRYGLGDTGWFSAAWQSALDHAVAITGVCALPAGYYDVTTTIDATGLFTTNGTNLPVNHTHRLRIVGAGSATTRLIGGEPGYGFLELIGSQFIDVEGISFASTRTTSRPQYGILGGRAVGNASAGIHNFKDVVVSGEFTGPAWFMLASEVCTYDHCITYPTVGHGQVLASSMYGWSITPKHASFGTGVGGNGVLTLNKCQWLSAGDALSAAVLLVIEGAQTTTLNSPYFASTNNLRQMQIGKQFGQLNITEMHCERYGSFDPVSIYIKWDNANAFDNPDYRDITIERSRIFSLKSDDGVRITSLKMLQNQPRSTDDSYLVDVAKLYDSTIENSPRLANFTQDEQAKIRVREENSGNVYRGFAVDRIDVPFLALDTIIEPEIDLQARDWRTERFGLNTVPGAGVSNSGMYAPIDSDFIPGTADFSLMVDLLIPSTLDANIRVIAGLGTSSGNLGGTNTFSIFVQNGRLFVRSLGSSGTATLVYGSVDTAFTSKFAGKRVKLLFVRDGATATLYLNGYPVKMVLTENFSGRTWADSIAGGYLLLGFQSTATTSIYATLYHGVALFNYAVGAAVAKRLSEIGVSMADMWGNDSGTAGCVGYWELEEGGGAHVPDLSGYGQHGVVTGTTARLQKPGGNRYRSSASSPVGVLVPRWIGDEVLTAAGVWFKSNGTTSADWAQLS